jgi:hypothetical protein
VREGTEHKSCARVLGVHARAARSEAEVCFLGMTANNQHIGYPKKCRSWSVKQAVCHVLTLLSTKQIKRPVTDEVW